MKLVGVKYTLDGRKAVFYFMAESRVDFRDLVRDLAIAAGAHRDEQIGARDESKLTGGIGPCGRELCCSSWLRDFEAMTVKMAREQSLALNPSRLAGMCGRLKCCLRYEYATYLEFKRSLPQVGKPSCLKGNGKVMRKYPQADGPDPARGRERSDRGHARRSDRAAPAVISSAIFRMDLLWRGIQRLAGEGVAFQAQSLRAE